MRKTFITVTLTLLAAFIFHPLAAHARTINAALQSRASNIPSTATTTTTTPRSPAEILRSARTLYIAPSARIDAAYVRYKLLKTDQLADWNITIVEDERMADLILKLDQVRLNYLFTITDPHSSAVVVSGKVVAVNDPVAADFLGTEIIKRMREVRRLR